MQVEASKPVSFQALTRRQVVITLGGILLAMFLSSLDQTVVGTAMPRIIADLGGFSHYTWVTTAYIISSTVVLPITGKITDMYGRKPFFMAGLFIFTIGSLLCGLSQSMGQIILYRSLQGLGGGILMANAFIIVGDLFPPAERGKYVGYMSAVFGISSIIGPTLGGFITDNLSWHWIFFLNIPLGVMAIFLFAVFFPNIRPHRRHQIDYPGVVTLILTVVPLMLAVSWGGAEYAWNSPLIIGIFAFSAVMLGLFIYIESRSREPIIPLSIFRNRIIAVSQIVTFFSGFTMFGSIIFVPLFFQGVLGLSATTSGSFLTPMMLGQVLGAFISGQLLSRAGGRYRLQGIFGLGIMAIGMFLLSRISIETSYINAVIYIVVTGFGLGTTMPLYTIAVQNAVPYSQMGVATSTTPFFRAIGGSVGLAIFGSALNNRFATAFMDGLSPAVKSAIPSDQLSYLAHNPQALVSPEAQLQLQKMLEALGPSSGALFQQLLSAMRTALDSALSYIFLIGFITILIALVAHLFIKEIPLRKHHDIQSE